MKTCVCEILKFKFKKCPNYRESKLWRCVCSSSWCGWM